MNLTRYKYIFKEQLYKLLLNKSSIIFITALLLLCSGIFVYAAADKSGKSYKEYQIKAAFIYNFMKFIDWPKEQAGKKVFTLGIVGKSPFGDAFDSIIKKKIKDKELVLKQFGGFEQLEKKGSIKECHLIFICASEKENIKQIIETVKDSSILTISDTAGFLESGGIINFLFENNKVRFEVNVTAAEKAKLEIRSKLLRLAKRVAQQVSKQRGIYVKATDRKGQIRRYLD